MLNPKSDSSSFICPYEDLLLEHDKLSDLFIFSLPNRMKEKEVGFVSDASCRPWYEVERILEHRRRFHICLQKTRCKEYPGPGFNVGWELRRHPEIFRQQDFGRGYSSLANELDYIRKNTRFQSLLIAAVLAQSFLFLCAEGFVDEKLAYQYTVWAMSWIPFGVE